MSGNVKLKGLYIFRQVVISSAAWTIYFILGLFTGAPTVLIPQLRHEANSTDAVSPSQASTLPAIPAFSSMFFDITMPLVLAFYGRRIAFMVLSTSTLISSVIFYCSPDIHLIMISAIFQGAAKSAGQNVLIIVLTEYPSSEWRGFYLTIKSASFFWGVLVANTVGTFFHWRNIPLLAIILSLYSLTSAFFWPESPYWLAQKRRFEHCARSHRWLKSSCESAESELETLRCDSIRPQKKTSLKLRVIKMAKVITKTEFHKPVLLSTVLLGLYTFSGKLVCTVYAIEMLKKITKDTSTAYIGMLILDTVTLISMYIGCAIAKSFRRRVWLFSFTSISIFFLFTMSSYLHLVKMEVVSQNNVISISLLVGYSLAIGCGPMIMASSIMAEVIPLESRNFSLCLVALMYKINYGSLMKAAPYLFEHGGMSGTFLIFGISSSFCMFILYRYLPETKDKTLHEIAQSMKGGKTEEDNQNKEMMPILRNGLKDETKN